MVTNVLTSYYKLGQDGVSRKIHFRYALLMTGAVQPYPAVNFDSQRPDGSGPGNQNVVVRTAAHTALIREIAAASAVLLKNTRSGSQGLPLGQPKTIAVIGQDAKMPTPDCNLNMCNDGTMVIGCVTRVLQEMGCTQPTFRRWGSGSYTLDYVVPPIDAIKSHIGDNAVLTTSLTNDINAAVSAARGKDVAIVFANA